MLNKLTYRLLLILALFTFSLNQPALAAVKTAESDPAAMKVKMADKINLNTATTEQLTAIKGIGTKKAQAIVDYRSKNGKFKSLEQLMEIKGIGEGIFKKIAPFLKL